MLLFWGVADLFHVVVVFSVRGQLLGCDLSFPGNKENSRLFHCVLPTAHKTYPIFWNHPAEAASSWGMGHAASGICGKSACWMAHSRFTLSFAFIINFTRFQIVAVGFVLLWLRTCWCWVGRPALHSVSQFISQVVSRVEVRTFGVFMELVLSTCVMLEQVCASPIKLIEKGLTI